MLIHTNSLSGNQPFLWDSYPLQFPSLQASVATASRLRACFQVSPLVAAGPTPPDLAVENSWFSWENDLRMVGFPTWYPRRHLHFQRFEQQKLGVTDERIGWEN